MTVLRKLPTYSEKQKVLRIEPQYSSTLTHHAGLFHRGCYADKPANLSYDDFLNDMLPIGLGRDNIDARHQTGERQSTGDNRTDQPLATKVGHDETSRDRRASGIVSETQRQTARLRN